MPPTKPAATSSRARPIATLRQEPPTTGVRASRPAEGFDGRKSISASPQLKSMPWNVLHQKRVAGRCLHGLAAVAVEIAKHFVDAALSAMEVGHLGFRRFASAPEHGHAGHRRVDRAMRPACDRSEHCRPQQYRLLRLPPRYGGGGRGGPDLA